MRLIGLVLAGMLGFALISCSSSSDSKDTIAQDTLAPLDTLGDSLISPDSRDQDGNEQLDTVEVPDTVQVDTPFDPNDSMLTLRMEARFGSTDAIQGLTLLLPSGLYHTEKEGKDACVSVPPEAFVLQLKEAVAAANPWAWGEAGLTGNTCGTTSMKYVLYLEDLAIGKTMTSTWCGGDEDAVTGRAEIIKKVQKLTAFAEAQGTCDIMPRVLGIPVPDEARGITDETGLSISAARFSSPTFCVLNFTVVNGELYRTNTPINLDQATADAMAQGLKSFDNIDDPVLKDTLSPFYTLCPEMEDFFIDPAALGENGVTAVSMLVGPDLDGVWNAWLATSGTSTYISPSEENPTRNGVRMTNMIYYKIKNGGQAQGQVSVSSWYESTIKSAAYEYDTGE